MPTSQIITEELRKISVQLGALAKGQEQQGRELAEIKIQVRATNGRVTALEAAEIAYKAVEVERAKFAERIEDDIDKAHSTRLKTRDLTLGAFVTLTAVIVGAILADVQFFG